MEVAEAVRAGLGKWLRAVRAASPPRAVKIPSLRFPPLKNEFSEKRVSGCPVLLDSTP